MMNQISLTPRLRLSRNIARHLSVDLGLPGCVEVVMATPHQTGGAPSRVDAENGIVYLDVAGADSDIAIAGRIVQDVAGIAGADPAALMSEVRRAFLL